MTRHNVCMTMYVHGEWTCDAPPGLLLEQLTRHIPPSDLPRRPSQQVGGREAGQRRGTVAGPGHTPAVHAAMGMAHLTVAADDALSKL